MNQRTRVKNQLNSLAAYLQDGPCRQDTTLAELIKGVHPKGVRDAVAKAIIGQLMALKGKTFTAALDAAVDLTTKTNQLIMLVIIRMAANNVD